MYSPETAWKAWGGGRAGLKYIAIFFLFMQALDNFAHFESLKRMGAQLKTENVSFFFGLFPYGPPPKPMLSMGHFKLKK